MKRLLLILFLGSVLSFGAEAQQLGQNSHYVLNYFGINPAVAGSSPCLDLKLGYRKQWIGVDGSPTTGWANLHGKFGEKKFNFHGVGGKVESDDTGTLGYTSLHIAYAYHLKLNNSYMLSMGVAGGFMQYRVDLGSIILPDIGAGNDPAFSNGASEFMYPQVDFGLWLYGEDRFYGFSMKNVAENAITVAGTESKLRRHYFLTAGRAIELSDGFVFKPSAHLKYVPSSRLSLDMNAFIDYKEKVEVGIGFRSESGLVALLKVDLFTYVTLGYAYDYTLSKMRFAGPHTHEIVLGIKACGGNEGRYVPCSAYD